MTILGTVRDGVIVPNEPLDVPEGANVELTFQVVTPGVQRFGRLNRDGAEDEQVVLIDDEQPDSPEDIERWLTEFWSIPPMKMTPEEEAAWVADRKAVRDSASAGANARIEAIRKSLE